VPAGIKFLALFLLSITVYLLPSWQLQLVFLALAALIVASCHPRWGHLFKSVLFLLIIIGAVVIATGLMRDWTTALISGMRLLTVCLFAYSLTITTRFEEMLSFFEAALTPFRRFGLNPAQVALTLALTIRFVPELRRIYLEVREAQFARGLRSNPVAVITPFIVRILLSAEEVSEALDARCYDSDFPAPQAKTQTRTDTENRSRQ